MKREERKQLETEEKRELILNTASDIIAEEGIENLSVRKITARIRYSPAILYHYFRDKDEIIDCLMRRGYGNILSTIAPVREGESPQDKLAGMVRRYIEAALKMPEMYRAVLSSNAPGVLAHTSSLFPGASKERRAIRALCDCICEIDPGRLPEDAQTELTAQVIWTSTYGLIIRLILEKEIPEVHRHALIERHIRMVLDAAQGGE